MAPVRRGPSRSSDLVRGSASLTRYQRKLLDLLLKESGGLTVHELATSLDLHTNTIRGHLEVLQEKGLVHDEVLAAAGPGRPARRYRAVAPAPDAPVEHLVALLSAGLRVAGDDAPRLAREWGRELGRELVVAGVPERAASLADAIAQLMAEMGFAPVVEEGRIGLYRCPLLPKNGKISPGLCEIHLGMIEEIVAGRKVPENVNVRLRPFDRADSCTVKMEPGAAEDSATPGVVTMD